MVLGVRAGIWAYGTEGVMVTGVRIRRESFGV